jgi:hypothetical protein
MATLAEEMLIKIAVNGGNNKVVACIEKEWLGFYATKITYKKRQCKRRFFGFKRLAKRKKATLLPGSL